MGATTTKTAESASTMLNMRLLTIVTLAASLAPHQANCHQAYDHQHNNDKSDSHYLLLSYLLAGPGVLMRRKRKEVVRRETSLQVIGCSLYATGRESLSAM